MNNRSGLFLKLTLISQGYETIEAASGKEALNQAVTENRIL